MRYPPDSSTDTFARSESAFGPRGDERLLVVEPAAVGRARPGSSALRSAKINPSANVCPGAVPERNIRKGRKCQYSSTDYVASLALVCGSHQVTPSSPRCQSLAEVRLAELRKLNIKGEEFPRYNVDAFRDINEIDLLLVNGLSGSLGEMARCPALHVLESQLASNCDCDSG
jgi:hypothetical protein